MSEDRSLQHNLISKSWKRDGTWFFFGIVSSVLTEVATLPELQGEAHGYKYSSLALPIEEERSKGKTRNGTTYEK